MFIRRLLFLGLAASFALAAVATTSGAAMPSGQRVLGQSEIEPVYNDENAGQIGYIKQPINAPQPIPANQHAVASFYLVVYPVGTLAAETFLCQHTPAENCPTHGNNIATLAMAREPLVYGLGVAGHDHLMDFPGGPDFNIAWEPTVVLFTAQGLADGATNQHILTDGQIQAALANGDAIKVPLPTRTFICASVPAIVYDHATPAS
jgi:hypothetical protein